MPIIPRSKAESERVFDYMKKFAKLMEDERMPAREASDALMNALVMSLVARRLEDEAAGVETITIIIDKLRAMRNEPDAMSMGKYLIAKAVRVAEDC